MLTSHHMKSCILHPNLLVSHAAITYFSNSNLYLNDATLMPLVLQRLKQVKQGEIFYLYEARLFTQTEETVSEMMGLLLDQNLDPNIKFQLTDILLHSDLSLFEPYQEVTITSSMFDC